jgi:HD-GYP domain-containing protein (c-di-GMP phosphodiesterase class II)
MGRFLWHQPRVAANGASGLPHSAAAVRLHPSRPGWILALNFRGERCFDAGDIKLIGLAGAMLLKQHQHSRGCVAVKESLLGLVRCLAAVIDAKDSCTAGHSERVSRIAIRIGRQMGLPGQVISDLHLSGLMHDVGKIGVPDAVLLKPGRLSAEEQAQVREHVLIGDQIVSTIKQFTRLRPGVRNHHEHYDGTGYPDGLAGQDIPLIARILAVADSCDAMMSARRYRGPMAPPQIDAVLLKYAGTQWDPEVVEHFMDCRHDIYPPIHREGTGDSACHAINDLVDSLKEGTSAIFRLADGEVREAVYPVTRPPAKPADRQSLRA